MVKDESCSRRTFWLIAQCQGVWMWDAAHGWLIWCPYAAFAWGVLCAWCLGIIGTNIYFPEEKSWVYVYGSDPVQTVLCQPVWTAVCVAGRCTQPASWGLSICPARWHSWGQCVIVPSAAHLFALCSDWWIPNDKTEDLVSFLLYSSVSRNLW